MTDGGSTRKTRAIGGLAARTGVLLALGGLVLPASSLADPLPERYAYELVTPAFTQGQRARPVTIADDGNSIVFVSTGGFADVGMVRGEGTEYRAERTADGWRTTAVTPPGTDYVHYQGTGAIDWSPDLQSSLWWATKLADKGEGTTGSYFATPIVRTPGSSWLDAGPVLPTGVQTSLVGTSVGLDRVVISTRARPALDDGTTDTRGGTRESLLVARRAQDGTVRLSQVAQTGGATMFSTCALELGGGGATARGAVSADGDKVFFSTKGLPSCVRPDMQRIWAKVGDANPIDLSATQCSVDCGTAQRSTFEGAARDGSRVFFSTEEKLVDADGATTAKRNLYEYDFDRPGNKLVPVTVDDEPEGAGVVRVTRVSDDGSRTYFVANGRPLAGPNARNQTPEAGEQNLYVYHRTAGQASGSIDFVAPLDPGDVNLWGTDAGRRQVQASPSGRFFLFGSIGDPTGERLAGDQHQDLYRYDAADGSLSRLWSDDPAHNGAARGNEAWLTPSFGGATDGGLQKNWLSNRPMTDDGSKVVFLTKERLSTADVNDFGDAYLWDAATDRVTMLSDGKGVADVDLGPITPSGDAVFFNTSSQILDKQHTSTAEAIYSVRLDGGFPDPPLPPEACSGAGCQGPPTPPLPRPFGATESLVGPGNAVPPPVTRLSPKVKKPKTARGSSARLVVDAPAAGRIRIAGSGLRSTATTVKGPGARTVAVRLTQRAAASLRRSGRVRTTARVTFVPKDGAAQTVSVRLTYAASKKHRTSTQRSGSRSARTIQGAAR